MELLQDNRLIHGAEGTVVATIGGNVKELAEVTKITADMEVTTTEYRKLGSRSNFEKPSGWKGTGSATLRYGSKIFRDILLDYVKTGVMKRIDIVVLNNDPSFSGKDIKTKLGNVLVKKTTLTQLDIENGILDEEIEFTFTEVEDL